MTPIERRAEELRVAYPDAFTPYWWRIARPIVKVILLTLSVAPATAAATQGLDLSPLAMFLMALAALAAGYGLSEMAPGFATRRP
jgi:hypothetical protein